MTMAWDRGDIDASMAKHRIEKDVRPTRLVVQDGEVGTIHYLYPYASAEPGFELIKNILADAARSITHLGWGIDMVAADASVIDGDKASKLVGERWLPAPGGFSRLRVPRVGTLDGLVRKHHAFLNRLSSDGFSSVPPLSEFDLVSYRPASAPVARPFEIFELLNDDDSRFAYPQDKLVHLAGMARHLAIQSMQDSPPDGVSEDWVKTYVAGHAKPGEADHRQFSYIPLPSVGYYHADPSVRRIMISAPVGDGRFLNHLARRLSGQQLQPTSETQLVNPPMLARSRNDNLAKFYTGPANSWASVTPVILPGHDDHKPDKTRKLIEKAMAQSGIDLPCTFEWNAISHFPKSLSAHKYDRQKRPTGYIRPEHLLNLTAIHLRIRFDNDVEVPGPIVIGAGRHCGLGTFAHA
jgi:CRISPR-associated protein Csb2